MLKKWLQVFQSLPQAFWSWRWLLELRCWHRTVFAPETNGFNTNYGLPKSIGSQFPRLNTSQILSDWVWYHCFTAWSLESTQCNCILVFHASSCYQQCMDTYAGFLSEIYFQMVHIGEYRSCMKSLCIHHYQIWRAEKWSGLISPQKSEMYMHPRAIIHPYMGAGYHTNVGCEEFVNCNNMACTQDPPSRGQ